MSIRKYGRTILVAAMVLTIVFSITGGTIAWFTDTVASTGNQIESGTLDIELSRLEKDDEGILQSTPIVDGSDPLFSYDLWEPGYTTQAFLRVENAGTLALDYQLGLKIDGTVTGDYNLADVIDVFIGPDVLENRTDLADASKNFSHLGTLSQLVDAGSTDEAGKLLPGEVRDFCLVLKMQESAGNEYQNLSLGDGVAILVMAKQAMEEEDAFDNTYDKDATFGVDVWNGVMPESKPETIVIDETAKTISVNSAEDLLYLTALTDDTYKRGYDWVVELETDIDFANKPIDTISLKKWGHFDGKGHTIYNVVLNEGQTGLFSNLEGISTGKDSFSNLTLDGVKVNAPAGKTAGALVGSTNASLTNITVKNAQVTTGKYAGSIAGRASVVVNCKAINCVVSIPEDGEKTVGGLVGYLVVDGKGTGNPCYAENNVVENVQVSGPFNVGGMFGQAQGSSDKLVLRNNTVKNTTVTYYEDVAAGAAGSDVSSGELAARIVGDVEFGDNTLEGNTITKK